MKFTNHAQIGSLVVAAAAVAVSTASSASPTTLLVDFHGNTGFTADAVTASNAEFAVNDSNIDLSAGVAEVRNDSFAGIAAGTPIAVDSGAGLAAEITITNDGYTASFASDNGAYSTNNLLRDYLFDADAPFTITVSSLEEIAIGDLITVTVYAVGDANDQSNTVDISQGAAAVSGTTVADGGPSPFVQGTFINDGSDISFTVTALGSPNAVLNGFSITSVVPEPGSLALTGLVGLMLLKRRRTVGMQ